MGYCKVCCAYYEDGEEFCSQCGTKIEAPDEVPQLDEVSAKDDLVKDLDKYRLILDEYEYLKANVKPSDNYSTFQESRSGKKSLIRYLWPFLVASFIAFWVILEGAKAIIRSSCAPYSFIGFVVAATISIVIVLYGFGYSRNKQAEDNRDVDIMNSISMDLYTISQVNQEKNNRLREVTLEKDKYDKLVPEGYCDFDHVAKIEELIMQNKASTVAEAIKLISVQGS